MTLGETYPCQSTILPVVGDSDPVSPLGRTENERVGLMDLPRPDAESVKSCTIMIVDKHPATVAAVQGYLEADGYERFATTTDATKALDVLYFERPDVVLMDIMMPEVDGLSILEHMHRALFAQLVPFLILTTAEDEEIKRRAFELGANDYLAKPVNPSDLRVRVRNALLIKLHQDQLAHYSTQLEHAVRLRTAELAESRQEALHCLARAGEFRDERTGKHVFRVGRYTAIIARELGFSETESALLEQAAQLHDVGKIGVPDAVLKKSGELHSHEIEIMRQHCRHGQTILDGPVSDEARQLQSHAGVGGDILGSCTSPVMRLAAIIAQTHHEKWDGTGYPRQLAGQQIPIEGRITAVADVFDALASERPYKEAFPYEQCFRIMEKGRGNHFDSRVLDAFFACKEEIVRIHAQHQSQ